jgi:hypothetical protein
VEEAASDIGKVVCANIKRLVPARSKRGAKQQQRSSIESEPTDDADNAPLAFRKLDCERRADLSTELLVQRLEIRERTPHSVRIPVLN